MKRILIHTLLMSLIIGLVVSCGSSSADWGGATEPVSSSLTKIPFSTDNQKTTLVFAAASLTESFTELGKEFEQQNPGIRVEFNFANASTLAEQILQGAPADVFASADENNMNKIQIQGMVEQSAIKIFARNQLVVIVPKDNPAGLQTLQDLTRPGIKLVTGTKEAPFGRYAEIFLDNASASPEFGRGFKKAVHANIVSQETTVKAVVNKVALGEADAGFCYLTDARAASDQVQTIPIPDTLNPIAVYPLAPLKEAPNPQLAQKFVDFVLSTEGQQILAKYGFLPSAKF